MGLTSRVSKMCGGDHSNRPSSAGTDSSADKPVKSPRRESMDRARAAPGLTASELG